jgi:hypothetical protein
MGQSQRVPQAPCKEMKRLAPSDCCVVAGRGTLAWASGCITASSAVASLVDAASAVWQEIYAKPEQLRLSQRWVHDRLYQYREQYIVLSATVTAPRWLCTLDILCQCIVLSSIYARCTEVSCQRRRVPQIVYYSETSVNQLNVCRLHRC